MRVLRYKGRDLTTPRPVECPKCTSLDVNPSRFMADHFFCTECLHNFVKAGRNLIPQTEPAPRFAVFHTILDSDGNACEVTEIGRFVTYDDAVKLISQHRMRASEFEYNVANQRWHFRVDHGPATPTGYAWQEYYYLHIGRPQ